MASEGTQRPTAVETLPSGTLIDNRYRIVATLGRGGFATVYQAEHVHMQRVAAVKVLDSKRSLEDDGGAYAERFLREARIISSIRHPNVVAIYDFGFSGSQPYIAMELLEGHDLQQELRRNGPLEPSRAHRLFGPALDALAAGHDEGIVHKDLKPSNLFICHPGQPNERLVVLDYGVARASEAEVSNLTETGELLGTPKYLAPEYIRIQQVTPAIDVYQMALILSEALCGKPATDGNPYTVMMNHCTGKLNVPHNLLNGPIGEVYRKAIAIEPKERYADARAFMKALATVEGEFRGMPRMLSGPTSLGSVDTGPIVDNTDRTPAPFSPTQTFDVSQPVALGEPPERNKKIPIYIAAGVVLLLGVAGLVGWAVNSGGDETTDTAEAAETPAADPVEAIDQTPTATVDEDTLGENETKVLFVSQPSGARVKIEGEERGITPFETVLEIGVEVEFEVLHEGYASQVSWLTPDEAQDPVVAALEALAPEGESAIAEGDDSAFDFGDGVETDPSEGSTEGGDAELDADAGGDGPDEDTTVAEAEPKPEPVVKKKKKVDPPPEKKKKKEYLVAP